MLTLDKSYCSPKQFVIGEGSVDLVLVREFLVNTGFKLDYFVFVYCRLD
jgi:hypothetical protein